MLRIIFAAIVAVLVTIPLATATIIVAMVRSTSPLIDRFMYWWARLLLMGAGIQLRAVNAELLEPKRRYILVANHYSYFDIPCLVVALPQQSIRFMAKVSLFRIPIFGWAIGRAGFIPIDRQNRRTAVKSFDLAAERIRKGNTIVVFPEEGRARTREMRAFQRGGFLLAMKSQLPVVPVSIDGTFDVFPAGARKLRPGPVTVTVTHPIETAGMRLKDKASLADESRARIHRLLFGDAPMPAGPAADGEDLPEEQSASRG